MPPIRLNRRRFLGCSAAAGLALAQNNVAGAASPETVRLGLIGLGNRGTTLLRAALEIPGVEITAVADAEGKHAIRAQGIAERARGARPEAYSSWTKLLERADIDAVAVALPCDLHAPAYIEALQAGKHLYAEKPLAPTLAECDAVLAESRRAADRIVHVGYQRRSSDRFRRGVELLRRGDLGPLIEGRASWISSNGPVQGHNGWLGRRERSGDWMIEQAVHVWDLFHWIAGQPPIRAYGLGRRDAFADTQPDRDVTDHYTATLEWADGFHLSFTHSWIDPADDAFTGVWQKVIAKEGGFDFARSAATFRDRSRPRVAPAGGQSPDAITGLPAFLAAIRADEPPPPPLTLEEARDATLTGLLVRRAVDERRVVSLAEIVR